MDNRRRLARPWLQKAREDVELARRALQGRPLPAQACFLCQQAAEKALKAALIVLGRDEVPRTHDLERLADAIEQLGSAVPVDRASLADLTSYASSGRYPDAGPEPEARAARRAMKVALRLLNWADRQ